MEAMKNAYRILIGKPPVKTADKRIGNELLKHTLKSIAIWSGLNSHEYGPVTVL
jgi:hypothetical protein